MRISDWSSDVCSSDLRRRGDRDGQRQSGGSCKDSRHRPSPDEWQRNRPGIPSMTFRRRFAIPASAIEQQPPRPANRSEEHTSELQSLTRISYAVFCLKKNNTTEHTSHNTEQTTNVDTT